MARRNKDGEVENAHLLETAIEQIRALWSKCEKKFMDALDDSERKRINVNFAVTLDLKESAPVVDTEIRFKDNAKEGGLEVTKTFHTNVTNELEDAQQPDFPGEVGEAAGRKKLTKKEKEAARAEAEAGK